MTDLIQIGWGLVIVSLMFFTVIMMWATTHSKLLSRHRLIREGICIGGVGILGLVLMIMVFLAKKGGF